MIVTVHMIFILLKEWITQEPIYKSAPRKSSSRRASQANPENDSGSRRASNQNPIIEAPSNQQEADT